MSLINSLEPRFGRWAIPSLLRIVALVQVAFFIMLKAKPELWHVFSFEPALILKGDVWRTLSFAFLPQSMSIIFILCAVMITFLINDILEQAWGSFRLNVYYFGTIVLANLLGFIFPDAAWELTPVMLSLTLFMAAAVQAPEYPLNLFGLLPVKVKWLGVLDGVFIAWAIHGRFPASLPVAAAILTPFVMVTGRLFIQQVRQEAGAAVRRSRFQSQVRDDGAAFHTCHGCGVTDQKDPHAEFRVAPDGEEYCRKCLEAGAGK